MTQKMLKNFKRFIFLQFLKENVKDALSKSRTLGDFKWGVAILLSIWILIKSFFCNEQPQ